MQREEEKQLIWKVPLLLKKYSLQLMNHEKTLFQSWQVPLASLR